MEFRAFALGVGWWLPGLWGCELAPRWSGISKMPSNMLKSPWFFTAPTGLWHAPAPHFYLGFSGSIFGLFGGAFLQNSGPPLWPADPPKDTHMLMF